MKSFLFIITSFLIIITAIITGINPQMHKPFYVVGKTLISDNSIHSQMTDNIQEIKSEKDHIDIKPIESFQQTHNISIDNVDMNARWNKLSKISEQEEALKKLQDEKRVQEINERIKMSDKLQEEYIQAKQKALLQISEQEEALKKLQDEKRVQETNERIKMSDKLQEEYRQAKQKAEDKAKYKNTSCHTCLQKRTMVDNILWNEWRANVSNNITMELEKQNFAYYVPIGTLYAYSFDVDYKRRITNIKAEVIIGSSQADGIGLSMLKNEIQSLNGSPVLTFPKDSQRKTVTVMSGIQVNTGNTRYLDANSFHDIEIIRK